MAEASKRCGFKVVSDGTPGGTRIYYQPEEGERVEIKCVSEFSMKMSADAAFYDITLIGELLGLELEVDRKQVRVTHDVQPPSPAPVWVPQQPLPLLEAMSMETFKVCLNIMERQPIKSEIHNRLPPLAVIPDISREHGTIRQAEDGTSSEDAVRYYTIERSIGTEADKLDDSYYNGKPARATLTGDITTSPSTHAILQETAPAGYWATKQ